MRNEIRATVPFITVAVLVFLCFTPTAVRGLNITWTKQFGGLGPVADRASFVVINGNIYVVGYTGGMLPGQTSAGGIDAFIRKYDSSGNELWTRQFGTIGTDSANSVAVDTGGSVYVVGYVYGASPLPGQTSAGGQTDAFVRKYDSLGNEIWTRQFGTTGTDEALGVAVDSTGVYVSGNTTDTLPGQNSAGGTDAFVRKYLTNGDEAWTRQFGTGTGDSVYGITVDTTGIYVVGETSGVFPGQTNAGGTDAFIRKYDTNGNEAWTRQFGTLGTDSGRGVAADANGVYVIGETSGTLPGQTSAGLSDSFMRKYDSNGNEVWTRQFGTSALDSVRGVAVYGMDIYVVGETFGSFPGFTNAGSNDAFVCRYDANGTEVWTRQFGTVGTDSGRGIAADANSVYVIGETSGTLPGQTSAGLSDSFMRKYDSNGNEVWTRQFGGVGAATDEALAVATDEIGYVYVVGQTYGTLPGQNSAGQTDAFIRKYDLNGNEVWTRQFGTAGGDSAYGVTVAAEEGGYITYVYVVGETSGVFPGQTSAGSVDAFIRKYDTNGNEVWTWQFGTSGADSARGVAFDVAGDVYVVGDTSGTLPGQTSAGGIDTFVRKYNRYYGAEVWTRQFGSAGWDRAAAVAVAGVTVSIAGTTSGTLPGQTSAGNTDAFIREYGLSGTEFWTNQFGTSGQDEARAIATNRTSTEVYVTGITYGSFPGHTNAGINDVFVRMYAQHHETWTRQFGTGGRDETNGIAWDLSGVYIAGNTTDTLPNQSSMGGSDAFVRKYDVTGNEVWTKQFGTASAEYAQAIAVNTTGVYIAGHTGGSFPGQTNVGLDDAYLAKIGKLEVKMGCPFYARLWRPLRVHVYVYNHDCSRFQTVAQLIIRGIGTKIVNVYQTVPAANCLTGQPGIAGFDIIVINSVPLSLLFKKIKLSVEATISSGEIICCDSCVASVRLW
jgi:hypothetical protein